MKKNWALSVDQCWLQVLQFSVYLTDVLSILLKCNAFPWILKAVVDQTASRAPAGHQVTLAFLFFGASLALGNALELLLSPTAELVITGCPIKSSFIIHHCPVVKWFTIVTRSKGRQHFKMMIFFFFLVSS